jgi:hypothetical protein
MANFKRPLSLRAAVVTLSLMSLAGCATVVRSPSTDWSVSSVPTGAEVQLSNGFRCYSTPCSLTVERKRSFTATVSMPGYLPETVSVGPRVGLAGAVAFLGNGVIGGLLGASIDIWTGSTLDPAPNGKIVTLKPDLALDQDMSSDATSACSQEKFAYALRVGVPCSSLGERVDVRKFDGRNLSVAARGYLHSGM